MAGRTEERTAGFYEGKHTHKRVKLDLGTIGAETQAVEDGDCTTDAEIGNCVPVTAMRRGRSCIG